MQCIRQTCNDSHEHTQGNFLPKRKHEEASSSEALTSSLGLYKQMFPTSAAAGVMDDVVAGMEQASCCGPCYV